MAPRNWVSAVLVDQLGLPEMDWAQQAWPRRHPEHWVRPCQAHCCISRVECVKILQAVALVSPSAARALRPLPLWGESGNHAAADLSPPRLGDAAQETSAEGPAGAGSHPPVGLVEPVLTTELQVSVMYLGPTNISSDHAVELMAARCKSDQVHTYGSWALLDSGDVYMVEWLAFLFRGNWMQQHFYDSEP